MSQHCPRNWVKTAPAFLIVQRNVRYVAFIAPLAFSIRVSRRVATLQVKKYAPLNRVEPGFVGSVGTSERNEIVGIAGCCSQCFSPACAGCMITCLQNRKSTNANGQSCVPGSVLS